MSVDQKSNLRKLIDAATELEEAQSNDEDVVRLVKVLQALGDKRNPRAVLTAIWQIVKP